MPQTKKKVEIAPSILAADFRYLEREVKAVEDAGADRIHCDIMDGVFVSNISFGPMVVAAVKKSVSIPLDVHLMVMYPEKHIDTFVNAGADNLTVHAEACNDLSTVIDTIHRNGVCAGVTVNPDIPISSFDHVIDRVDLVLIMSVFAGSGGQPFIFDTMAKVQALVEIRNQRDLNFSIEVDGGINKETAATSIQSGVNILVSGSYIYGSDDYRSSIANLRASSK
jgi:ribulose-phosphate 3-epimerase